VTPLGHSVPETWQALWQGRSGIARITLFDSAHFPTKIGAEVKNWNAAKIYSLGELIDGMGRNTQFAMVAAQEAVRDAGLEVGKNVSPRRCGVYMGSGEGAVEFDRFMGLIHQSSQDQEVNGGAFIQGGACCFNSVAELEQEPNMASMHIATAMGVIGPNQNCLTACAASSQAIGEATEIIRRGDADVMVSGGAHSMLHPLGLTGFNLLTALSTSYADEPWRASRPFDAKRDGFILGEGAGILILEELEHAKKRGAKIYGELVGYGSTADAYRITDSHPDGRGAIAAIKQALHDAAMTPGDVDYINAHGTSTQVNDSVETKAIKEVFQERAAQTPVSSNKSIMGHLIAAAGAVELIASLMTIRDGVIAPTLNYENPDPDCDLDYVPNVARQKKVNVVLSNSFGFGGQNISLIVKKFSN
jgi:3-oxoacyl-[acyl-carrier-protein] synthase II